MPAKESFARSSLINDNINRDQGGISHHLIEGQFDLILVLPCDESLPVLIKQGCHLVCRQELETNWTRLPKIKELEKMDKASKNNLGLSDLNT